MTFPNNVDNLTTVAPDCTDLYGFQTFSGYMSLLRNRTSFEDSLLEQCRDSICGTLWGYGVPDISGIGASVGYVLVTVLGPLLSILLFFAITTSLWSRITRILTCGLTAYFESAIYFAIAVQFASIAIIVKKDYETTSIAFGGYEARSCSLVTTISLLPLMYPVSILSLLGGRQHPISASTNSNTTTGDNDSSVTSSNFSARAAQNPTKTANKSTQTDIPDIRNEIRQREPYRLTIFCFAVLLSLYPFISQSLHSWTPSPIGEGRGDQGTTYVTEKEWAILESVCFGGTTGTNNRGSPRVERLTSQELTLIDAFHTIGSFVLILYTVAMLVPRCLGVLERYYFAIVRTQQRELQAGRQYIFGAGRGGRITAGDLKGHRNNISGSSAYNHLTRIRKMQNISAKLKQHCTKSTKMSRILQGLLFLVPIGLVIPLLWGFWRLRELQGQLAVANTGDNNEAGEWGFGQVMAITIFLPVVVEMAYVGITG